MNKHILMACALLTGLTLAACNNAGEDAPSIFSGAAAAPRVIPVVAAAVVLETETRELEMVGTSRALRSVELRPEVAGFVADVAFSGGEHVTEGDLLVALETRDEQLAVQLAEVRVEDAEVTYKRYADARGREAVPPTTLDSARTALKAARIELDRARVALEDRYLRAPFTGVVGLTDMEPGDRVEPTTLVTTLDDRTSLLVSFEVPEAYVGRIVEGQQIQVETWTADRLRGSGPVVTVGSRIDPATRSFTARAQLPNGEDRLRPGMSFRVQLRMEGARWPVVPEVSVQWGASGPFVWAIREGTAERVGARVIQRRRGRVLVDAALEAGELVVAEGVQRMRQNVRVQPIDALAPGTDVRNALTGSGFGR